MMNDDNGLAEALAAQAAKDEARAAKLEEYRQGIRSQLDTTVDNARPELHEFLSGIRDPLLREAFRGLAVMNTVTATALSLSIQNLTGVVLNLVPEEKRARAMEGLSQMASVISEEAERAMNRFDD